MMMHNDNYLYLVSQNFEHKQDLQSTYSKKSFTEFT